MRIAVGVRDLDAIRLVQLAAQRFRVVMAMRLRPSVQAFDDWSAAVGSDVEAQYVLPEASLTIAELVMVRRSQYIRMEQPSVGLTVPPRQDQVQKGDRQKGINVGRQAR